MNTKDINWDIEKLENFINNMKRKIDKCDPSFVVEVGIIHDLDQSVITSPDYTKNKFLVDRHDLLLKDYAYSLRGFVIKCDCQKEK